MGGRDIAGDFPMLSSPISAFLPDRNKPPKGIGFLVRPELAFLYAEHVGSSLVDPNKATYEFLKSRLKPGDEILINYEDIPMMFYLDSPVREARPVFESVNGTHPRPGTSFFGGRRNSFLINGERLISC